MSLSVLLGQIFILACALFLAGQSYRLSEKHNNTALMVISLAAAFIACSAAGTILLSGRDQDSQTLLRLLNNLAFFAAIPLIASALLDLVHKFDWSKAAWGRWLLVLFALFELCRRSEIGIEYSQGMSLICSCVVVYSGLRLETLGTRLYGVAAGLFLGVGLLIFSPVSFFAERSNDFYYSLCLASTLTLLSIFVRTLLINRY